MTVVVPPGFWEFIQYVSEMNGAQVGTDDPNMGRSSSTGRSRKARKLIQLPKKKRKVSAYQKEFGRQLKALKKKHPKTPVSRLMKRAHVATRKARK
ncbi:unnamed protein product [marine sediment metagenome]|uniref:Uncharacterized protein n=1 Tax=marine sediment metagenome TaxID=412755 RepID=X1S9X8_9ZZZZ